jgi:alkylation response protein AidB-like acyl-CoA dehydrogenase
VRATFTDEQEALADAVRDLASEGLTAARALLEGGEAPDEPTASLLGGFSGLAVDEEDGGAGGDLVDLAIVLEGLGRTTTPTPWVAHVLAVQTAYGAGLDVSHAAAGEERLTLATDGGGRGVRAVRDGAGADAVVVATDDGVVISGVGESTPVGSFDPTRPMADLVLGDVRERSGGRSDGLQRATAALSAELVGVGRGAVDLAVDHAKVREQFDQPIGRFQGVAHQLADAWTAVELAWSLALYACWAVGASAPEAARAVHTAKAKAGTAAIVAAERCTQVHGGIGITREADPHLYLRRALADDAWLGGAAHHRRRVGELITGGEGA